MFEKIQTADLWILDNIFQKIADWVWDRAPINCFNLAKGCVLTWALSQLLTSSLMVNLIFVTIISVVNLGMIVLSEFLAKSGYNRSRDIQYPSRIMMAAISTMSLGVLIFEPTFKDILYFVGNLSLLSLWFFISCQIRPPVKRTKREWILKLLPIGT